MCESVHCIQISNVENGETFQHSVVLLKGVLSNPCSSGRLRVVSTDGRPVTYSVAFENCSGKLGAKQETNQYFRILLRLSAGENGYEVEYCSTKKHLRLVYTVPISLHTVLPLYIICNGHDGRYQSDESDTECDSESACRKITLAIELLQCLYAEKLYENGFGRKTFTLEASCVPFRSQLAYERSGGMAEGELWQHFATELVQSQHYDMERVKVVAFLSSTHFAGISDGDYSYENIRKKTTGHAALGGGGLALFGTGCLYTWPSSLEAVCAAFLNQQPIDCAKLLDDSNYRRTYGGCFATTLGSVCHEMGHTFDLGHTPDGSIMGDGFDDIDKVFVGTHDRPSNGSTGPKRVIETKPHGPAGKLTQLRRPGDVFRQRLEAKQNDYVFFAPISALTLCYHRWFNQLERHVCGSMRFDSTTRTVVCSNTTLVLVELRQTVNGMMQRCWTFNQLNELKATFTLPKLPNLSDQTLFVMDTIGNVLKVNLSSENFAQI
ncbi:uncharacterized protein LOC128720223 [Anopheles nili]|uniref:uncharacterized protein LOC128720223 n=1 Tax=Anopheles nili TaxID=185578 RepID=UPI00237BFEF8|nr:uncharacterized protein LOC128720223 [Anopheles nili]